MADYKHKKIKQKEMPREKHIFQGGNPEQYYTENPAWCFLDADEEMWPFSQPYIGECIWTEIFPYMKSLESQTWNQILIKDKKRNHSINIKDLNKIAQDRLISQHIEAESLISLRLNGTHRLYGYMTGRVFHILWYDVDHGDNKTCVCRSHLKHT